MWDFSYSWAQRGSKRNVGCKVGCQAHGSRFSVGSITPGEMETQAPCMLPRKMSDGRVKEPHSALHGLQTKAKVNKKQ